MTQVEREALKTRIMALPPARKIQLLHDLMDFAHEPDLPDFDPQQSIEEVEAELRAAGFTDNDLNKLNRRIDEALAKARGQALNSQQCPDCGRPTVYDVLRHNRWCPKCYKPVPYGVPPQISWSAMQMLVATAVDIEGSQKAAAKVFGVSPQYLSDILRGRREITDQVAKYFGLERVVVYMPILEKP